MVLPIIIIIAVALLVLAPILLGLVFLTNLITNPIIIYGASILLIYWLALKMKLIKPLKVRK